MKKTQVKIVNSNQKADKLNTHNQSIKQNKFYKPLKINKKKHEKVHIKKIMIKNTMLMKY